MIFIVISWCALVMTFLFTYLLTLDYLHLISNNISRGDKPQKIIIFNCCLYFSIFCSCLFMLLHFIIEDVEFKLDNITSTDYFTEHSMQIIQSLKNSSLEMLRENITQSNIDMT